MKLINPTSTMGGTGRKTLGTYVSASSQSNVTDQFSTRSEPPATETPCPTRLQTKKPANPVSWDNKEQRDTEILSLWHAGWSGKKIAEHLDIAASTVVGVVHRNKATWNPRGARDVITADLDDAPVEAWQQAMLPHLQRLADTHGFAGKSECTFVFLWLLRLKPFEEIGEFKDWVHCVTGYPRYEIDEFVDRRCQGVPYR